MIRTYHQNHFYAHINHYQLLLLTKISRNSLQSPYETNCWNYVKSQSSCYDKCITVDSLKETKKWPENVFAEVTKNGTYLRNFGSRKKINCIQCSRIDCTYIEYAMSDSTPNLFGRVFTSIKIHASPKPDTIIIHLPSSTTFALISNLVNIFALWFGISFVELLKYFKLRLIIKRTKTAWRRHLLCFQWERIHRLANYTIYLVSSFMCSWHVLTIVAVVSLI